MESRRAGIWLVLVVGVLLALISIFADQIGLGRRPDSAGNRRSGSS
jgi:hypothetical protein